MVKSTPPICRLSDPAQPHKLCQRRSSDQPLSICFSCKGKHLEGSEYYFYCDTCNVEFHKDCQKFSPEIKHPYHPSHPLTLILPPTYDISKLSHIRNDDDDHGVAIRNIYKRNDDFVSSEGNHKCKCCERRLQKIYYHCSICNFNLNWSCSLKQPDLSISHTKSHSHPFNLFPIQVSSACDACGLSLGDTKDLVYSCLPCSHLIHKRCIYLPRVIKITRHHYRLSFTTSLFAGDLFCGVCRQKVDPNYGRYSCHTGCQYVVHSKCATREDVWDGKDLEEVPEEPEEDIEPFVGYYYLGKIRHFSHEHWLKLQEKKNINEKAKFCEACNIPVRVSQWFYGCMECDFVLDESCASLPRKKYHPLHKHPLTLHPIPVSLSTDLKYDFSNAIFRCNGCQLESCGFRYICGEKDCEFQLDVRCAALPDPFVHGCHPQDHPLFFNLTEGKCIGCGSDNYSALECIKCKSFLGLKCATLPSVAQYKHDRHPLTLCYGDEDSTIGQYWCEICEEKLDSKKWFYTCDTCRITLHIKCLLEKDFYMKPNHIMKRRGHGLKIVLNDGNTRVVCWVCQCHCEETFVFKDVGGDRTCCSLKCMQQYPMLLFNYTRHFYKWM